MPQHLPIPFAHFFVVSKFFFFVELVDSKSARHLFESCHDGKGEKIKKIIFKRIQNKKDHLSQGKTF